MKHLLKILEIKHIRDGEVVWEAFDLPNTLHLGGEQFLLSVAFNSASGVVVPNFFYLGMDNRSSVSVGNNMQSITTEPSGNGYSRKPVSSSTGFTLGQFTLTGDTSGIQHWRAVSGIFSFTAVGSAWGPVSNVFITNQNDNTGFLIATAPLGSSRTVSPGDGITFSFALSLVDPTLAGDV